LPPTAPLTGFQVLINGGSSTTDNQDVNLTLRGSSDTIRMSISNDPSFTNAIQESYTITKSWRLSDSQGQKTVYVKFFTTYGVASETLIATINYQIPSLITPIINIINPPAPSQPEIPPIPPQPPVEEVVTPEAPSSLSNEWNILPTQPIKSFVLSPMPQELRVLAQKFPQLSETFEKIGISKITDVGKLVGTNLTLPTISQAAGLVPVSVEPGQIVLPNGVPLENLTILAKEKIPTEILFAKTSSSLIDYNSILSLNDQGHAQQQITTLTNQPVQLIVKPDKPAKAIKGYLIFKQKKARTTLKTQKLTASLFQKELNVNQAQEPEELKQAMVLIEFSFSDPDNDGIWTADITTPPVDGEYEIVTVIDYQDQRLQPKELTLITVVDPEGYVYYQKPEGQIRVKNAKVTLYWLNPETRLYEIWPAKKNQQTNPQTTDVTGRYSFLVPEGSYYLKVEARGYVTYYSEEFEVKNTVGLHENIELKKSNWLVGYFDWKIIVILIMFIFLIYNFYRDKIRYKKLQTQIKKS
jgi:hypothetical protein